jgi:hypothetical protein
MKHAPNQIDRLAHACVEIETPVFGNCFMPNHFHRGVQGDRDLSRWMLWLLTAHVRRHHMSLQQRAHLASDSRRSLTIVTLLQSGKAGVEYLYK